MDNYTDDRTELGTKTNDYKSDSKGQYSKHEFLNVKIPPSQQKGPIEDLKVYEINEEELKGRSINVDAAWCLYLCSVLAGCNAECFTYPLDFVKTRMQIQGEKASKMDTLPKQGIAGTAMSIVKNEGLLGFWRGISAIFLRHLVYTGTRLVIYKELKDLYFYRHHDAKTFPVFQGALAGMVSGGLSQLLASPADLIKIQMQMDGKRKVMGMPPRYHSLTDAVRKIYMTGGLRGLFKGWVPSVQRAALVNFGDLTTYDLSKQYIQRHTNLPDQWLLHVLASYAAGFSAAVLSTPADVIKSRIMNQPIDTNGRGLLYTGSMDCLTRAIKEEGLLALYKGFVPTWLRLGPWALVFWISFEQFRIHLEGKSL